MISLPRRLPASSALFIRSSFKRKASNAAKTINTDQVGLPIRFYIPPAFSSYPSIFRHPIVFFRLISKRLYNFGRNTAQIGFARFSGSMKPQFLLWKNSAVDIYVQVNKAFARRKIENVESKLSIWARSPLLLRQKSLPTNCEYVWNLKRLVSPPKLEIFLPYTLPGAPLDKIILIYKIHTEQELVSIEKATGKKSSKISEVQTHLAFVVDIPTNELKLCGSTFESGLNDSVEIVQPKNAGTAMQIQGDIFRPDDSELGKTLIV